MKQLFEGRLITFAHLARTQIPIQSVSRVSVKAENIFEATVPAYEQEENIPSSFFLLASHEDYNSETDNRATGTNERQEFTPASGVPTGGFSGS